MTALADDTDVDGGRRPIEANALLTFLAQVKTGDFSARMPLDWTGVAGKVADGFNEIIIGERDVQRGARTRERRGRQTGTAVAAHRARGH